MKNDVFLLDETVNRIQEKLGDRYVVSFPNSSKVDQYLPDLEIKDKYKGSFTLVELSGSSPKDQLPFAIVPTLRRIKDGYANTKNLEIVLVSLSNISDSLKEILNKDNVQVVSLLDQNLELGDELRKIIVRKR